ncbi:MAG: hypothetical protein OJF51_000270 [Nitrospira sp.]|nr:MAG: hypothetical protein OJF51_000270 [Nitrospira sp.]
MSLALTTHASCQVTLFTVGEEHDMQGSDVRRTLGVNT